MPQTLVHFDLPAQPLARSLKAIGTATNTDVGFSASQVAGLMAPAVKADLTVDDVLTRVLVGTGLRPRRLGDHTIAIAPVAEASTSESGEMKLLPNRVVAVVEADDQLRTQQGTVQSDATEASSLSGAQKKDLEEIVVTGTHIVGGAPVGSPLITISEADI